VRAEIPPGISVELQATMTDNTTGFPFIVPSASTSITPADEVGPLAADYSWTPESPAAGAVCRFVAKAGPGYGNPTGFEWEFPGGVKLGGRTVEWVFSIPGPQIIRLTARNGASSEVTTRTVIVRGNVARHL
jgi:hypothetical protein